MAYIVTPGYGMKLADPATIQAFETAEVNSNFLALENGLLVEVARVTAVVAEVDELQAGAGRGNLARESVVAPANLTAISDGIVGDKVLVTSPGTGISPFWAQMISGSGTDADWVPAETIIADTKANLDTFIAAWVGDTDLTFTVGAMVFVTGTTALYRITSTAGALKAIGGLVPIKPTSVAGTGVTLGADGRVSVAAASTGTVSINGCFTSEFDHYLMIVKGTATSATFTGRLRAAGTDEAGSTYGTQQITGSGATAGAASSGTTAFGVSNSSRDEHRSRVEFFNPADAEPTTTFAWWQAFTGASGAVGFSTARNSLSTSYDGLSLIASSGNFGATTIQIFAYNDN